VVFAAVTAIFAIQWSIVGDWLYDDRVARIGPNARDIADALPELIGYLAISFVTGLAPFICAGLAFAAWIKQVVSAKLTKWELKITADPDLSPEIKHVWRGLPVPRKIAIVRLYERHVRNQKLRNPHVRSAGSAPTTSPSIADFITIAPPATLPRPHPQMVRTGFAVYALLIIVGLIVLQFLAIHQVARERAAALRMASEPPHRQPATKP
jgi:hypothetical protein